MYHGRQHAPWAKPGWQLDPRLEDLAMRQRQVRMPSGARLLLPVLVSLAIQVPASLFWMVRSPGVATGVTLALAILGPLALLLRRRYPGPVVAVVALAACVDFLISADQRPPFVSLAFAVVLSILHGARVWAWISVGGLWIATVTAAIVLSFDLHPARVAITTLGILVTFGVGEAMRTRHEHFEEFRRTVAQRRQTEVQAERVRIARELHDVLAHSLSQINVQAGVGLHLMDKQPEKAAEALASIKEVSKTALDEVRSVLGVLRSDVGEGPEAPLVPEPDLSRLPGLAASVTSQGVEVTVSNELTNVPKALQLAMYRIVQESLTNVVRHAKARHATVTLRADKRAYVIEVADDGIGVADGLEGGGRGMLGMRERAELLGGTLDITHASLGGVLVTARIPIKEHE